MTDTGVLGEDVAGDNPLQDLITIEAAQVIFGQFNGIEPNGLPQFLVVDQGMPVVFLGEIQEDGPFDLVIQAKGASELAFEI